MNNQVLFFDPNPLMCVCVCVYCMQYEGETPLSPGVSSSAVFKFQLFLRNASPLGGVALTATGGHYLSATYCSVDQTEVQDPQSSRRIRFDGAKSNDL